MKKIGCMFLVVSMIFSSASMSINASPSVSNPSTRAESSKAEKPNQAYVLRGTNQGLELDRALTRLEGLVLLIRLLGNEESALAYTGKTTAFTDIPEWGKNYVNYAANEGLVKGLSEFLFGANDVMSYTSFCTFMLRVLGYREEDQDFDYATAETFATQVGIGLTKNYESSHFTRNDAIDIMMKTLNSRIKGDERRLVDFLTQEKNLGIHVSTLIDPQGYRDSQVSSSTHRVVPSIPASAIRASSIGMIPNSQKERIPNAKKLNDALNTYGRLVIDDVYYIGDSGETIKNKKLELIGEKQAELIFDITQMKILFGAHEIEQLKVSNITFTNLKNQAEVLIVYSRDSKPTYIDSVVFDQCVFQGDISAFRQKGDKYANPSKTRFGIGSFVLSNSHIKDTTLTFLKFIDLPFNEIIIRNNYIQNFQHSFADISLTNGIKYGETLRKMRNLIRVSNNQVINSDTWWARSGGMYHTFILAENNEIIYMNNHVEGLKADFDIALYDAYLSSLNVTYMNNRWINNICFADTKNNTLIKAKSGMNGSRLYQDNTFIVEAAYAQRLGQPLQDIYVQFIDINQDMKSFRILNNHIDVYDIRFQTSSRDVENFEFAHNTIKATYASGKLFIPRLVDKHQSTLKVNDNVITIEQNTYRAISSTNSHNILGLIDVVDQRSTSETGTKALDLEIKNNLITAPLTYVINNPICDQAVVIDNQIFVVKDLYKQFSYGGNQPQLEETRIDFQ